LNDIDREQEAISAVTLVDEQQGYNLQAHMLILLSLITLKVESLVGSTFFFLLPISSAIKIDGRACTSTCRKETHVTAHHSQA
jgi:fumarate reductase subunit C